MFDVEAKLKGRPRAITPQLGKTIDYLRRQGCGYKLVAKILAEGVRCKHALESDPRLRKEAGSLPLTAYSHNIVTFRGGTLSLYYWVLPFTGRGGLMWIM